MQDLSLVYAAPPLPVAVVPSKNFVKAALVCWNKTPASSVTATDKLRNHEYIGIFYGEGAITVAQLSCRLDSSSRSPARQSVA
jgi:hypothetical protein